ncbi:MAG: RelA/SpoT family protein [Candidatus Polarisedimenticolaceae bacterium]|nr:RelA/SpoT family protein [Candidatus Polarisedimenticolaceae bacterium]
MQNRIVDSGSPLNQELGKPHFQISDLCNQLESYLKPEQIREVYRAYQVGAKAHEGQRRRSGEAYIFHPLAVAHILSQMRMDHKCLMAALLHDVIEDTATTKEQLIEQFDQDIVDLVDGVSKLTQIDFKSKAEAQAASFRKMLLAMTKDIRVILIKLADRLHNMRTLGVMRPEKCRRIARETLDIYAPIANRLGINNLRLELEELGFSAYWPMRYRALKQAVHVGRGQHTELVETVETALSRRLRQEGLDGEVAGRQKHLYSIYRKMQQKSVSFNDLVDVFAFRIIVDSTDTCYRVLGAVHNLYKPVPGRFKDYIAIPKANGYQSLHTVLFGPQSIPIEIQIRTQPMERMAESGIAAHWMYKTAGESDVGPENSASEWLRNLLELQQGVGDSIEFLEHVKVDLFPDEVYVFTPLGEILVLPRGATVVDFAYAVHTDVGNNCVAARVDRHLVPLRTQLLNGQTVEIIGAPGGSPSPVWLNYVVTSRARANIRGFLKNLKNKEAVTLGGRLLEKELIALGSSPQAIEANLPMLLSDYRLENYDKLLEQIALGNRMSLLVARRLVSGHNPSEEGNEESEVSQAKLTIRGTEGMVVNYAKCCRPIPGDAITGIFTPGKGIVVHRQGCRNLGDYRRQGSNWIEVEWQAEMEAEFSTEIQVTVDNRRGVLAMVASEISTFGSNIENVGSSDRDGLSSILTFVVSVQDRVHLARIMRHLYKLPSVITVSRSKNFS